MGLGNDEGSDSGWGDDPYGDPAYGGSGFSGGVTDGGRGGVNTGSGRYGGLPGIDEPGGWVGIEKEYHDPQWSPIDEFGDPQSVRGWWSKYGFGVPSIPTVTIAIGRSIINDAIKGKEYSGISLANLGIDSDNATEEELSMLGSIAQDPFVKAYFDRYPEAVEPYKEAKQANPNWTPEAWSWGNYQERKAEGQNVEWRPTKEDAAKDETLAYFYNYPEAYEPYHQAKQINPNWARNPGDWARRNFEERRAEGQDVRWGTEIIDDGTGADTGDTGGGTGDTDTRGIVQQYYDRYNPPSGQPADSRYNPLVEGYPPIPGRWGDSGEEYGNQDGRIPPLMREDDFGPYAEQNRKGVEPNARYSGSESGPYVGMPPAGSPGGPPLPGSPEALQAERMGPPMGYRNWRGVEPNAGYSGSESGLYAGLNTDIWNMYNQGYSDISSGRDLGIQDIQNAIASGRGDITSALAQSRADVERGVSTGRGDITSALAQSRADVERGVATGRTDISEALERARADVERGVATGRTDLTEYYGKSKADLLAGQERGLGYYEPYTEAGGRALGTLEEKMMAGPGQFTESPGYQFRLQEGIKAMERASSARGGTGALFDPRLYKELEEYGQGMATDEYDKFINRYYQSLTPYQQMVQGVGLPAAGASADISYGTGQNLANIGMATGTNMANLAYGGGQTLGGHGMQAGQNLANLAYGGGQTLGGYGMQAGSNLANLAYGGGQTLGGYGMTAGTNLANMGMTGGIQNALLRTGAGTQLAGLGQDAARTAVSNRLAKEGMGIDWARLGLGESEAGKGRTWQTGESALDRASAEKLAEKGYNFYANQASRNRNTSFWNNIFGGLGLGLGFAFS